jgi:hypothetical protein
MWNWRPLAKESEDWIYHADDLIPLSEVDHFTSGVAFVFASMLVRVSLFILF